MSSQPTTRRPIENWAQVMMEVGISCVLAGDRENAITFFNDAAELFGAREDHQSVAIARGWLKALTQAKLSGPSRATMRPTPLNGAAYS